MVENLQPEPEPGFSVGTTRGAVVTTLHTNREVKIYGVLETEIETLSNLGREQRLWSTISASSFILFLGCVWDMVGLPDGTQIPKNSILFSTCAFLISVGAFFKSHQYGRRQKSAIAALIPNRGVDFWDEVKRRVLTFIPERTSK